MTEAPDAMPDPDAETLQAVADQEDGALRAGVADDFRQFLEASVRYQAAQAAWLRARTMALALAVRERDDVNADLERELEGYRRSAAIEMEAVQGNGDQPEPAAPTA